MKKTFLLIIYALIAECIYCQIDTVASYFDMNIYEGSADSLYLDSKDREGLFYKCNNGSLYSVNGGTTISGFSSDFIWCRSVADSTYRPEWWDEAVGYSSWRIQAAIDFSCEGCVIQLKDSTVYEVDRKILIKKKRTLRGGKQSVLKRWDLPVTKLEAPAFKGDTFIVVENSKNYLIGQSIILVDDGSLNNGKATEDNNITADNLRTYLKNISGDTLFLDAGISLPLNGRLQDSFPVGTTVFPSEIMVFNNIGDDSVTVENVIFDGNQKHLNYDWRILNTLSLGNTIGHKIMKCLFYNTPSENITVSGSVIIESCEGFNLGGSFVHISSSGLFSNTVISNCVVDGSCLNTNKLSGHSEGVINFSSYVKDLIVRGCHFKKGKEGVLGLIGPDDDNTYLVDNVFEDHRFILLFNNFEDTISGLKISKNNFISCGQLSTNSLFGVVNNVYINNNEFSDCFLKLENMTNLNIIGNMFISDTIKELFSVTAHEMVVNENIFIGKGSGIFVNDKYNTKGSICNNIIRTANHPLYIKNTDKKSTIIIKGNAIENLSKEINSPYFAGNLIFSSNSSLPHIVDNKSNTIISEISEFEKAIKDFDFTNCNSIILQTVDDNKNIEFGPSPAFDYIRILGENDFKNINIYNSSGVHVLRVDNLKPEEEIDISTLPSGLYYISITTINSTVMKKIIFL